MPFVFFARFVNHFEDRYLAMILPACLLMTGIGLDTLYILLRKLGPGLAVAVVVAVVARSGYQMAATADVIVKGKLASYGAIRDVGLWIKQNTRPGDTVVSSSVPQNTYYSERATFGYPKQESEFRALLKEKTPRYMVLSVWERSPNWAYKWPYRHTERSIPVKYFMDETRKRPAAIVYQLR